MANTTIQKAANTAMQKKKGDMRDYVQAMLPQIQKALPSVITPERFTRMVLTALSNTPELQKCTPKSFLGAMMAAAQLGVEPNTPLGQAYLIPYKNHGVLEAQFQLGYKGLIDLAYRSGEVEVIQAHVVYQNDEFEYEYGLEPKLTHKPALGDRGEAVAVYAMFKTKSGGFGFEVMSMDDARRHAQKYSKSYGSSASPWQTAFDEMAKKTVLKSCLKYAPLKSDFVRAVASDETIKTNIEEGVQMVDQPDETVIDADYTVDGETGEVVDDAAE